MRNLLGIVDLSEPTEGLGELTVHRTLGAVPFGGRYRIIDFTLSNMVNAGIRNVGILLNDRFGPLLDHIKDGKEWDLNRQRDGMFLLPAPLRTDSGEGISSNLINLRHNRGYLEKSRQDYVLFSGCGMVSNIDYQAVLDFHLEKKADITVIYSQVQNLHEDSPYTALVVDQGGRVTDIALNPRHCTSRKVSLNMFVLRKDLLINLVDHYSARQKRDLFTDAVMPRLAELRIYGYEHRGYVGAINSLKSYYQRSMDLLKPDVWQDLFFTHGQISTKVKHEAPVRYLPGSKVSNSLIATGCTIEGTVENSILFRGVEVGAGVVIKDSIVMQKAKLGPGVALRNVILDKDVTISAGKSLAGDPSFPVVISKAATV
ncbi:MAG: glucose-1-phosphate adenylyltransferase subunit GlgD [Firmicutes bacterium]|nr:glucose-1-phosphate adenylyltransferase subunit GlgD [Bacillota bacterium]